MRSFELTHDFMAEDQELELLSAVAGDQAIYWELNEWFPPAAFSTYSAQWIELGESIRAGQLPFGNDWGPAAQDPQATARRLHDLYQRRLLAEAQQKLAQALYDPEQTGEQLAALLESESIRVKSKLNSLTSVNPFDWGSALLPGILALAGDRRRQRQKTGKACMGIPSGFSGLDQILNGFGVGLHVLAAGPGAGKTTLALQWCVECAQAGYPAVYVTYENSPQNLVLKLLAARAGISCAEVERGYADPDRLAEAAATLQPVLDRLAIIEGTSKLTMAQVQSRVRQVQNAHGEQSVFVVLDYLQRAAHQQGYDQLRHSVSAMAGQLREMANQTGSTVLAISSQNRSGGDYGRGAGTANLDSLKESGDLEYSADTALFLCPDPELRATAPARGMKLVVLKNRFGATGSLPLIFRPDIGVYREPGRREDPA